MQLLGLRLNSKATDSPSFLLCVFFLLCAQSFDLSRYSPDEESLDSFMEDHPQTSSVSENITSLDEVINKMSNVLTLDDLLPAASAATDADTVGSVCSLLLCVAAARFDVYFDDFRSPCCK